MQEINLLQNEHNSPGKFSFNYRKNSHTLLYIVLALLAVELLYYGFLIFSNKQIANKTHAAMQKSADIDLEISKIDDDRLTAISVQSRLKSLDVLLDSHFFWSKVFGEVESKTYKAVRFESLQVDYANSRFIINGLAPTQTDLAKLMAGLKTSPYIQQVNFRTSTAEKAEEAGFLFNIEVTFDSKLLRR